MAYEVLARKWRPQQFDDVVGQPHVIQTLKNAIEHKRIAHAYLFVGPRGTGKTSTARIVAKALNCQRGGPTVTPCDQCDSCREIMAGNSLDVMEIDAASNTGVDYIRELRETVNYAPARGPFKVYIIDEVHMLSTGAFNALLKTLEEPPAHVKFLFATTEPQKLPATILSRVQRFDLRRIGASDLIAQLRRIAKAETIDIDDDALLAIARGAEGGLRDAESALDQLTAFCGKTIRENDVLSVFGLVSHHMLESMAEAVLKGDTVTALTKVHELDQAGKDFQRVLQELMGHFRNLMIQTCGEASAAGLDVTESYAAILRAQAGMTDTARVLRILNILTEAETRLRYSLSRRTLMELALVRCARAATTVTLEEVLHRLDTANGHGDEHPSTHGAALRERPAPPPAGPAVASPATPPSSPAVSSDTPIQKLIKRWREVVDATGRVATQAHGWLLDARPVSIEGQTVRIGFDPEFATHKDDLAKVPRAMNALRLAIKNVLGQDLHVELCVLPGKQKLASDIEIKPSRDTASTPQPTQKEVSDILEDPGVVSSLEIFGGRVIDVRK